MAVNSCFLYTHEFSLFDLLVSWDHSTGQYVDLKEYRGPTKVIRCEAYEGTSGHGLPNLESTARLSCFCHGCGKSALRGPLLVCDFCPLAWHLDCLWPPLSGPPPPFKKWMCPTHIDHFLPRTRRKKEVLNVFTHHPGLALPQELSILLESEGTRPSLNNSALLTSPSTSSSSMLVDLAPNAKQISLPLPSSPTLSRLLFTVPESSIKTLFFHKVSE